MPPRVLVTSLGLIGGSVAAALKSAGWDVLLHHRRPEVAAKAQALGFGRAVADAQAAVRECSMAVVCTPVTAIAGHVRMLAAAGGDAVITDVGSTKGRLCAELAELARAGRFVGSHPMAGSHLQGLEHASATLFRDRLTIVTPETGAPTAAVERIESLWHAIGARTVRLAPDVHDRAVVAASHLPHVLAATAAAGLDDDALPLAASGFRDTTRVAGGSPELWSGILCDNREMVIAGIEQAIARLEHVRAALAADDVAAVSAWLERGRAGRMRFERRRAEER